MKQAIRRWIPFCLICIGAGADLRAERLPIRIYTSADGLGSTFVDYVTRDSRGFMWFCTRDGLSRFDGARFITYRVGDTKSPPGIDGLSETSGGVFWISTTGGLYRFTAGDLSRPNETSGDRPFLNAQHVDDRRGIILEDRHGALWALGDDLYRVHDRNGAVEFEKAPLNLPRRADAPISLLHMVEGADGSLWIQTNHGLARRLPDGRVTLLRYESTQRWAGTAVAVERTGRIWVGWGAEIFVITPAPATAIPSVEGTLTSPLTPSRTLAIEPDQALSRNP